jgi:hypothetical protein
LFDLTLSAFADGSIDSFAGGGIGASDLTLSAFADGSIDSFAGGGIGASDSLCAIRGFR